MEPETSYYPEEYPEHPYYYKHPCTNEYLYEQEIDYDTAYIDDNVQYEPDIPDNDGPSRSKSDNLQVPAPPGNNLRNSLYLRQKGPTLHQNCQPLFKITHRHWCREVTS